MPVGTQSAVFMAAVQSSYAAADAAAHAAAHVAIHGSHHYRNAALLELADRFLGELSEAVIGVLKVSTIARKVLVSAAQQRHAIARRQLSTQADADLVALKLQEAVANLRFLVTPQRNPRIFELIGYSPSADKCIVLPLKLVPAGAAKTGQDEWWIQTAIPFGAKRYRYRLARKELVILQTGSLPKNFSEE
jgi:hypothetical protein